VAKQIKILKIQYDDYFSAGLSGEASWHVKPSWQMNSCIQNTMVFSAWTCLVCRFKHACKMGACMFLQKLNCLVQPLPNLMNVI